MNLHFQENGWIQYRWARAKQGLPNPAPQPDPQIAQIRQVK